MKTVVMTMMVCVVVMLAGCEEFLLGVGSGMAVAVDSANRETIKVKEYTAIMAEKSKEMEIVIETIREDPMAFVAAVNPELKTGMDVFMANLEEIKENAIIYKEESGEIDWAMILGGLGFSALGGGNIVNMFKNFQANRKKTP